MPNLVVPHAGGDVLWTVLALAGIYNTIERTARRRSWWLATLLRRVRSERAGGASLDPTSADLPDVWPQDALWRLADRLVPDDWPPTVQPLAPDGNALVPLLFAGLEPGDADCIVAGVEYVLAGHPRGDRAFAEATWGGEDAELLRQEFRALAHLVRLGWDEDERPSTRCSAPHRSTRGTTSTDPQTRPSPSR